MIPEDEVAAVLHRIREDSADEAAWSVFYEHFRGQILGSLALSGVRGPGLREELCAQTLYRFVRYSPWRGDWSTLPSPAVIGAYLRKTTGTVTASWFSNEKRPGEVRVEKIVTSAEDEVILQDLIGRLGAEDRRFLDEYARADFSLQRTASAMGISYTAAGTRLHRLRQRLRELRGPSA